MPGQASASRTAFVPHDLEAPVKGAPSGLLAGLSAAVKDMYDITGTRTGGGNPDWLAAQKPASSNAAAVQKILDAGAEIIGKTVCDEFFFSVAGVNAHYGTPENPRAPGRIPGGSSSGSASATASGACDFALGSDTGGSVRVPAALCGLYGIRTTLGRVDLAGAMAMSPSFDTVGWFASGPGVFRNVGRVLLDGSSVRAEVSRLIVAEDAFAQADPEVAEVLRAVLARAAERLPAQQRQPIAPNGFDSWRECVRIIQGYEIWQIFGAFIKERGPRIGPGVKERLEFASTISGEDVRAMRVQHEKVRDDLHRLLTPGTIVALPTTPCIAPRIDADAALLDSYRTRVMRLTCIAGLGGLPQVSLPLGSVGGCPVGLSLIAWAGGDETLLDVAAAISRYSVHHSAAA